MTSGEEYVASIGNRRIPEPNSTASRIYYPPFRAFDPRAPVRVYYTNLPHWRQDGCTYFVTYRLADSIPKIVLGCWEREKSEWLAKHGVALDKPGDWKSGFVRLSPRLQSRFFRHFNRQVNDYLDQGRGSCVLRAPHCSRAVIDGWRHFDGRRYCLGDIVVMPNHVHLLLTPYPGEDLERVLQSRKRQSTREINRLLKRTGSLWQKHSFDHIVRDERWLAWFQEYIEKNPNSAGLKENEFRYRRFDWASMLAEANP